MSDKKPTIDEKIVFCVAQGAPGEAPTAILGIPTGAWVYMADGKTHDMDLTKIGIPVKIILFGGSSHRECMSFIERSAAAGGIVIDDQRRKDFSIGEKKPT